jgi:alpha-ketoglutarate-dependent taurine dioxygenase
MDVGCFGIPSQVLRAAQFHSTASIHMTYSFLEPVKPPVPLHFDLPFVTDVARVEAVSRDVLPCASNSAATGTSWR